MFGARKSRPTFKVHYFVNILCVHVGFHVNIFEVL